MLVLIVVLVSSTLIAGLLEMHAMSTRRQRVALDTKNAFYLAEAGLAEAYTGLMVGKTGNVGTEKEPAILGQGILWVAATEHDQDRIELESTGMSGLGAVTLGMIVERGQSGVASLGVFTGLRLELQPGVFIDSYDSSLGPYQAPIVSPQSLDPSGAGASSESGGARVGSNAGAAARGTVTEPTTVLGDLVPGPGYNVEINGNVRITGTTRSRESTVELPPVEVPALQSHVGVTHAGSVPLVIAPGKSAYDYLAVEQQAEATIYGPATVVFGDLTVRGLGKLGFETSAGPVTVYITGALDFQDASRISFSHADPAHVTIQIAGTGTSNIRSTDAFFGTVYGPEAQVWLGTGFELFGALIANELTFGGPVRLHFDRALARMAERLALPTFLSWRIVEISSPFAGRSTGDPFTLLGLDPETLPLPAEAHADQRLEIVFVDHRGLVCSYQGMESSFDWGAVAGVIRLSRDGNTVDLEALSAFASTGSTGEPSEDAALIELIYQQPPLDSSALRDALIEAVPLSPAVLIAAIQREPSLGSSHLRDVLNANPVLSSLTLISAVHAPGLSSSNLKDVLLARSPLGADVLQAVLDRDPALNPGDLEAVLEAQG